MTVFMLWHLLAEEPNEQGVALLHVNSDSSLTQIASSVAILNASCRSFFAGFLTATGELEVVVRTATTRGVGSTVSVALSLSGCSVDEFFCCTPVLIFQVNLHNLIPLKPFFVGCLSGSIEQSSAGVEMVAGSNFWLPGRICMDLGHFLDDLDHSCSENLSFTSIGREGDRACFVRGQRGG
jgi:hypothetical protein